MAHDNEQQKTSSEMKEYFANNIDYLNNLRDVTKAIEKKSINTINKEQLKQYIKNITSNEVRLREIMRYLYYRSNILFRLVNWYSGMWELDCRQVIPNKDLSVKTNKKNNLQSYNDTLDFLDILNMQGNMVERLINVYLFDVSYALAYIDETGTFFYELDPDDCVINGRYSTGDFAFCINMSKWRSAQRQQTIEYLGSPLKEMWAEYKETGEKWVQVPAKYASCFKFRTDDWKTVIPPFISLALSLGNLEDLVDIQANADELSIYKLIYMPLDVLSGTKESDDFQVSPALAQKYFNRMIQDDILPSNIGAAIVPGKELKTIEFPRTADSDTTSVEKASDQILQTAGGGAVLNANKITSTAAFNAWLKEETEFAMSTVMPQINGYVNRMLLLYVNNPCKVKHFEVSTYTIDDFAKTLLESCQYSFANRLAYNTCLGISEKATLAMLEFENEILGLPETMIYPLQSSYTQSSSDGEVGQGAPTKDAGELTESGDRSRNQ